MLWGCPVFLDTGRYRNRHSAVLKVLAHHLQSEINVCNSRKKGRVERRWPRFLKEGLTPNLQGKTQYGLVWSANDWKLQASKFLNFEVSEPK